jgi:glycosyltransferase involved in cell wall biosynthesis
MKLSICINTYNRNDSLEICIKSINNIINKNKININIIISDNSNNGNLFKIKKKIN